MIIRKPSHVIVALTAALVTMLATVQCSKNNNTTPPSNPLTVASVTVNPGSIAAGGTSQGAVTLSATTGSAVTLSSSNTAVATVPGSVTIAAGSASANFTVTGVGAGTATITASISGSQGSVGITVTGPPPLTALGLTLSASTVVGGNPVTGTLILSTPAPAGGTVVSLSSTDPVSVPASVTIPAGQTTATFTVNTRAVGGAFNNVAINATAGSLSATATLTVTPAAPPPGSLQSIALNPSSVAGGGTSQGTATLTSAAPAGGTVVTLSSGNAAASVPGSITIPAGSTSGTFTVTTTTVSSNTQVTITGSAGGATQTATLTVTAASGPVARFTVTGPSGANSCKLINGGNQFDCSFDGSASTASGGATVIQWNWSYTVSGTKSESSAGATLNPNPGCALLPNPSTVPAGTTFLQMTVNLVVRDTLGVNSTQTSNNNVRVLPDKLCGFPF